MDADAFSRWFLAVFFVTVGVFYTVSIVTKGRRSGVSPVQFGRRGSRHWLIHSTFRVFRAAILLVCLARLAYPRLDTYLVPIEPLWSPAVMIPGNLMMLASFVGLVWMHNLIGEHWRSGIPESDVRPLITTGPFARSRNPMFLLIQAAQVGFFLSLPSAFSLVCLIVGVAAVRGQARLEEAYLDARHGDEYAYYKSRTPRWL